MSENGFIPRPRVDFSLADAKHSDVTYTLFQNFSKTGRILREEYLPDDDLDMDVPLMVFIHGWRTDGMPTWYNSLKEEFFKLGRYNILYINWSKAGNKSFDVSCANVKPMGKIIAEFLLATDVSLNKIHIVSHSLGCHLAGYIGKYIHSLAHEKISRITALDPGGPKFDSPEMGQNERLCENDANFVDVIHTDINFCGYTNPIGHVDFYPNGGNRQPGCPTRDEDGACSHDRSTFYYIESLGTRVIAKEAWFISRNSEVFVIEEGREVVFGHHVSPAARGVYYLTTDSKRPFLKF